MKSGILIFIIIFIGMTLFSQTDNWQWANVLEDSLYSDITKIEIDTLDNTHNITGIFKGNMTIGNDTLVSNINRDIFIAKADSNNNYLWKKSFGGPNNDYIHSGMTHDSNGNIYLSGNFSRYAYFDSLYISTNLQDANQSIFVAKIDRYGNCLWVTSAGSDSNDVSYNIKLDENENYLYVVGKIGGNAVFGADSVACAGKSDVFISKLDTNGNWIWTRSGGADDVNIFPVLDFDSNGNIYSAGMFKGSGYFGNSYISSTSPTIYSSGICKIDSNGNWIWGKVNIVNNDLAMIADMKFDGINAFYVTGRFKGDISLGNTSFVTTTTSDGFLAKMDTDGNWIWAKQIFGNGIVIGSKLNFDNCGNPLISVIFDDNLSYDSQTITSSQTANSTLMKTDKSGNFIRFINPTSSGDYVIFKEIAIDKNNDILITGSFKETLTFGSHSITAYTGQINGFTAKLERDFICDFNANVTSGYMPLEVNFTDITKGNPTTWQWDFDNNGYIDSTQKNPTHTYFNTGDYTVSLLSDNGFNNEKETKINYINVSQSPDALIYSNTKFINFGNVKIDSTKTFSATITNYGLSNLYITEINTDNNNFTFNLSTRDTLFSLSSMQSKTIEINFIPSTIGSINGNIVFSSNDPNNPTYSLSLSGIGEGANISSPNNNGIDFGTLYLPAQSGDSLIIIQNTGNINLEIDSLYFSSSDSAFSYTYNGSSISAGDTGSIHVSFSPDSAGSYHDTLFVVNNSYNNIRYAFPLVGNAQYAAPEKPNNVAISISGNNVVITWNAVTKNIYGQTITPDGYTIYYSESPYGGNYTALANITNALTYTHQNIITSKSRLFYKVVAYITPSQ